MTAWLLSFGWNWALLPALAWLLNGIRKALLKPQYWLVSHSKFGGVFKLEIERQERTPPWRTFKETWVGEKMDGSELAPWVRMGDGLRPVSGYRDTMHPMQERLSNMLATVLLEQKHTEACIAETEKS